MAASLVCPVLSVVFLRSLQAPGTFSTGESGLIGYYAAMLVGVAISVTGLLLAALYIVFRNNIPLGIAAVAANLVALVVVLREFL